jgi:DNA-binding HxlR family transcriptional regulator
MPFVEMNGCERLLYPARIYVLKTLMDNKSVRFQKFRKDLGMKDGSLWSNMRNLEEMGLITMGKEIDETGREAYTIYSITEKGKSAYLDLRNRLFMLLQ